MLTSELSRSVLTSKHQRIQQENTAISVRIWRFKGVVFRVQSVDPDSYLRPAVIDQWSESVFNRLGTCPQRVQLLPSPSLLGLRE